MNTEMRSDVIATIAKWAASFLASSLVLSVVFLFFIFLVGGADDWTHDHPVGALAIVLLLGCYAASFACLHKLRKGMVHRSVLLWSLSLVGASAPLAALVYLSEELVAVLIIGIAEIAAVLLHVVAIGIVWTGKAAVWSKDIGNAQQHAQHRPPTG